jgi:hypothetical protein
MYFLLRPESSGGDTWLLTIQTFDQMMKDVRDDRADFYPHEAAFRLSLPAVSLERVDDAVWLESRGRARECGPSANVVRKLAVVDGRLLHDGRPIPTAGSTVLRIYAAPASDAAAVLSVDGHGGAEARSGAYYHQVFWDHDGKPMGPPVRLDFPRPGGRHTTACWTPDDQYVIYVQGREGYSETEQFCVVPAAE